MDDLYSEYLRLKEIGELPQWESITEAELRRLYSNEDVFDIDLAKLFNVSVNKIRYKRNKHGLDYQHIRILKFFNDPKNTELQELNQRSKDRLFTSDNIDRLAIGLAHYFFRNGPVEDLHSKGQLSESDMKTLNKYMVDRIARVLFLATENRWLELELLLAFYMEYGIDWDKPNIDLSEVENSIAMHLTLT